LNFFVLFWITYKFYLFLVMSSLFFFIFVFDHYSFYCYYFFLILSFKIKLVRDWASCYNPSLGFYRLWFLKINLDVEDFPKFAWFLMLWNRGVCVC
jgi:hypothetical protein